MADAKEEKRKLRLFIAVPLSEDIKKNVQHISTALSAVDGRLSIVSPENLHFTLKFIGWVEEKEQEKIRKNILSLTKTLTPFEVKISGLDAFPAPNRPTVIWAGVSKELTEIAQLFNLSLPYHQESRESLAHLTLARVKHLEENGRQQIKEIIKTHGKDFFGQMIINKVVLFQSELRKSGPVYTVLEEFRLNKD